MIKRTVVFLLLIFISQKSFANMTCGVTRYQAVYDVNTYTCNSGYFLPANTLGCITCPVGATCVGGTFDFNPNNFQGLLVNSITGATSGICANNTPETWGAVYDRNTYNCTPGYYVPANNDGCVICPANSYCPGGTYTFNETTPQGITACPTGTYSPAGMWNANQCGHILHIGDASIYMCATKKTTPSLHIKIGNDTFYGNMTTADVPMNSGTTRKLKIQYNNMTYSVYDDTVNIGE